jgi:hypothetical protein
MSLVVVSRDWHRSPKCGAPRFGQGRTSLSAHRASQVKGLFGARRHGSSPLSGECPFLPSHKGGSGDWGSTRVQPNQRMKRPCRGGHSWWNIQGRPFVLFVAAPARRLCAIR